MTSLRPLFVILLLMFSSCSSRRDSSTLTEEEFSQVYARLTKHGISLRRPEADTSSARKTADSILASSGVSAQQMLISAQKFNQDPATWKDVMELVGKAMRDTSQR